ncbi:hypothetical protein [Sulfurovum riftiae]|uniref:Uncharacterized protein n=1 Tax=Sulfurovum riftiae TaxID=1630136 RepID=A0A151CH15_9BACT|nr:hypothetical protein [Sulfurovum riftiae]KYJ86801.1 hypothetical protein AS592_08215 [Sulfurovum riftiae]
MQLNELLEENSTKTISERTNIAEENIDHLMNNDFGAIKRVKTMGFISILEREYKIDLSKLREDAAAYYDQKGDDESVTLGLPIVEEKKGRSKWLWIVVPVLLGYASWYFFTQFDQSQLKSLLPFNEAKSVESTTSDDTANINEELSIKNVITADENDTEIPNNDTNSSENY